MAYYSPDEVEHIRGLYPDHLSLSIFPRSDNARRAALRQLVFERAICTVTAFWAWCAVHRRGQYDLEPFGEAFDRFAAWLAPDPEVRARLLEIRASEVSS